MDKPKEYLNDIRTINNYDNADVIGLERFTAAMRVKLAKKRLEGRGGWNLPSECDMEDLHEMLLHHVQKGDPVDIANFCMMIWNRRNPLPQPHPKEEK